MASDSGLRWNDIRKDERVELWGGTVEITYTKGGRTESGENVTLNISSSGLAVYSDREMKEGTELTVKGAGAWKEAARGRVVWCKKIEKNLYKVGIKIIER